MSAGWRPGSLLRWADRLSPATVILLSVAVPALLRLLLARFRGRRAWLLAPDDGDLLTPLPGTAPVRSLEGGTAR